MRSGRNCYLILGMHRSGTSAMAKVCELLGVDLGNELIPAHTDNIKGYFEDKTVVSYHEGLFEWLGASWDSLFDIADDWSDIPNGEEWQARLDDLIQKMQVRSEHWGIKDPRMSRFLPMWLPALRNHGNRVSCIIMLRNPLEVAASLSRRNGMPISKACWLWLIHLLEVERCTRGMPRTFVCYEDLLADARLVTENVAAELGIAWPRHFGDVADEVRGFLEPELKHHSSSRTDLDGHPEVNPLVVRCYKALYELSSQGPLLAKEMDDIYVNLRATIGPFLEAGKALAMELGPCRSQCRAASEAARHYEKLTQLAQEEASRQKALRESLESETRVLVGQRDELFEIKAAQERELTVIVSERDELFEIKAALERELAIIVSERDELFEIKAAQLSELAVIVTQRDELFEVKRELSDLLTECQESKAAAVAECDAMRAELDATRLELERINNTLLLRVARGLRRLGRIGNG